MPETIVESPAVVPAPVAEPTMEALAALVPDQTGTVLPDVLTRTTKEAEEAEPEAAEATAEVATEETPVAEPTALERAEAAAKKARAGASRFREMQEQTRRAALDVQRAAREAQQYRQQAEEARKIQEELKKDPYAALKKLGMTDQDLAERALREGTPEAALHQMNERLEAERQARLALEQRYQEREAAAARQTAEANFAREADKEDAYPRLAELNGSAQLAVARAALQQISNNGYDVTGFSDAQVAEACEKFLAPKKGKAAAAKAAPAPAAKPTGKTLTNAVTTTKTTTTKPWEELSDDEQIAQIAALLPDPA